MTPAQDRTIILAAIIGAVGVVAGAMITSAGGWFDRDPRENGSDNNTSSTGQPSSQQSVGPRAPEIRINQRFSIWGEDTMQISLAPDEVREIEAQSLYDLDSSMAAPTSCAGPGFVPYTWQVREPWPRGGELEVRSFIPRGGGATEFVGSGSTGSSSISPCGVHQFKNADLVPIVVEVRFASAADTYVQE